MNKKINTSSIDDNVQFVKVADSTFVDLDYFSSIEHCVATNKNLNNCYIFYNDAKAILVSIEAKSFFKYALFLSEVQFLNDYFKKNDCFLTSVSRILHKDFGVQWIAQTPTHCIYNELPDGAEAIPFATYRLDLSRSEEELFSQLNSKHRNVIKRAMRENISVKFGGLDLVDDYVKMDAETWKRSNLIARNVMYYKSLLEHSKKCFVAIAYDSLGIPQAGAIIPYTQKIAYYLHGCTKNNSVLGSANLLQWEIIKYLKNNSVKSYDFVGCRINVDEGSKYQGIQRFKERFGGELVRGYMFRVIYSKFNYFLYKLLITIRDRKRFKDVVDQEKKKWPAKAFEEYKETIDR